MSSVDHAEAIGLRHALQQDLAPEEPPALEEAAPEGETISEVRARLAARGLLRTEPAIVVPREPRAAPVLPDAPTLADWAEPEVHPLEVPEDDWDVEPESNSMSRLRCPQCREPRLWSDDVTRFRCPDCDRAWRWAVCGECDVLALTVERQESWRCAGCNHVNRSWWRTPSARRDAMVVVARRRDAAVQAAKAKVRAGMRRRRWKIIVGAVAGLFLALGFVVVVRSAEPTAAGDTTRTCAAFTKLRSDLASNTLSVTAAEAKISQLKDASVSADAKVQQGVVDLASAGPPGTAEFLVAQTSLADACDAVTGG